MKFFPSLPQGPIQLSCHDQLAYSRYTCPREAPLASHWGSRTATAPTFPSVIPSTTPLTFSAVFHFFTHFYLCWPVLLMIYFCKMSHGLQGDNTTTGLCCEWTEWQLCNNQSLAESERITVRELLWLVRDDEARLFHNELWTKGLAGKFVLHLTAHSIDHGNWNLSCANGGLPTC